jgi:hypothetical protein
MGYLGHNSELTAPAERVIVLPEANSGLPLKGDFERMARRRFQRIFTETHRRLPQSSSEKGRCNPPCRRQLEGPGPVRLTVGFRLRPPTNAVQERFAQRFGNHAPPFAALTVLLLKHIRDAQDTVMALSQNRTPEIVAPDVARFVSSLATAWRAGEVRPTHRQEPKPGHWWRTRPDPFAEVWPVLLSWLEERPDMEAKEMLKRLQASGYGEFPDGQLRTLQRRVQVWRMRIVQQLVYGADAAAAPNKSPSPEPPHGR